MPSIEPLVRLFGIHSTKLSREENILLEADLFSHLYGELIEIFRQQHKHYFRLMKFTQQMENNMLEENFTRYIINDILLTKEYSPQGIALYTNTHEDVVNDIYSGQNTKPLATFLRKIIELHKSVRRELYHAIGKKIISEIIAKYSTTV